MSKTCVGTDSIKPNDFIACVTFLFDNNLFSSKMFLNNFDHLLSSCAGPANCTHWSKHRRFGCVAFDAPRECIYCHITALRTRIPRGMTNKDVTKILLRCKERGDLLNPVRGLYKIPDSDMGLDEIFNKYLEATYIYKSPRRYYDYKESRDRIGYYTGVSLIQDFNSNLSEEYYNKQLSSIEICSNICPEKRTPTRHKYGDFTVSICKPKLIIDNTNYPFLEFLDLISLLNLKDVKLHIRDLRIHARFFQKKTNLKDRDFLLSLKKYSNSYPVNTQIKLIHIFPELDR